ncbi:MAG: hypothetical protein ACI9XO_003424 [Paraglaciecola sp.]
MVHCSLLIEKTHASANPLFSLVISLFTLYASALLAK